MVLILVVMEEGQRHIVNVQLSFDKAIVLILVVMEEGQRPSSSAATHVSTMSLNPCCNGRGSKTDSAIKAFEMIAES